MSQENQRYGFIGLIIEKKSTDSSRIQALLSEASDLIQGRMGLPHLEDDTISVITLIVRATPDEVGALTGRLGAIPGVSVKSGLQKK